MADLETLDQFAARTGVPVEETDPNAIAWILPRLSSSQRRAIEKLSERNGETAKEIGVASTTLNSLWDFRRNERDCLAPLMIVAPEFCEYERCRFWTLTPFGLRVKAGLAKARGEAA